MPTGVEASRVRRERKPRAEVIRKTVSSHCRTWVDRPSGDGFYTLDRTQGFGNVLIVTSYLLNVRDTVNRFNPDDFDKNPDSAVRALSDWEGSSHPSRDRLPVGAGNVGETQARFVAEWSRSIQAGSATTVETFRGQTPVRMVFQAA